MFSAVKIDGQRAYEIARSQESGDKEVRSKPVNVYSFEITAFRPGSQNTPITQSTPVTQNTPSKNLYQNPLGEVPPHLPQADFRIHCGKGTYIRSLARDLGLSLDSGAFLASLRREQVGEYTLDHALNLDQVEPFLTH